VEVRNYSNSWRAYRVTPSFRYADDAASGAVKLSAPPIVLVPPRGTVSVPVSLRINAKKLPDWGLDGGADGANGSLLAANEFDGYLTLAGGGDTIHLPWHVLPHRAADVTPKDANIKLRNGSGNVVLRNPTRSGQVGTSEVFALTGTSDRIPRSQLPVPGDNFAVIDLRAVGVRADAESVQFGITTFGQRAHPDAPGEFDVFIDANRDGVDDFEVFNGDLTVGASGQFDGRNAVFVQAVGAPTATAVFFTDADLDSANAILTVPLDAVGLKAGSQFDFHVAARDNYFTGNITDTIDKMTFTLGTPKFAASADTVSVPAGGSATVGVTAVDGGDTASPSQSGLLLLERDAKAGDEADLIRVS
jgi:minor extracellular serine protease Vpr